MTLDGHGVDSHDYEALAAYDGALADFAEALRRLHLEFGAPSAGQIVSASSEPKLTEADIDEVLSGKLLPPMDVVMEFVRVLTNVIQPYEDAVPAFAAQLMGQLSMERRDASLSVETAYGRIRDPRQALLLDRKS